MDPKDRTGKYNCREPNDTWCILLFRNGLDGERQNLYLVFPHSFASCCGENPDTEKWTILKGIQR